MPVGRLAQPSPGLCHHEYASVCNMRRGWGLLASLALLSTGCGGAGVAADRLPDPGTPPPRGQVSGGSNRVELLADGAIALQRLRNELSRATATIEAEIYEFYREDLASAMV